MVIAKNHDVFHLLVQIDSVHCLQTHLVIKYILNAFSESELKSDCSTIVKFSKS